MLKTQEHLPDVNQTLVSAWFAIAPQHVIWVKVLCTIRSCSGTLRFGGLHLGFTVNTHFEWGRWVGRMKVALATIVPVSARACSTCAGEGVSTFSTGTSETRSVIMQSGLLHSARSSLLGLSQALTQISDGMRRFHHQASAGGGRS